MNNNVYFPVVSNMSLAFVPMIITIILSEILSESIAVYLGCLAGTFMCGIYLAAKPRISHVLLYITTAVLVILGCLMLFSHTRNPWPQYITGLLLETILLLPLLILYANRRSYSTYSCKKKKAKAIREHMHITTLTISSIRIFFGLYVVHCILIIGGMLGGYSIETSGYMRFMFHYAPALVFVVCIAIGQVEVRILRDVTPPEFVPVVTPSGSVIGKIERRVAEESKCEHTLPLIRIALLSEGMLFLSKSGEEDRNVVDTPLETNLLFRETMEDGVERLLKESFPNEWKGLHPEFSIKYCFRNEEKSRLVYLFILDCTEQDAMLSTAFPNGKLWTTCQIEDNVNHGYFSEMFENEFDHLKMVAEMRGKYALTNK